MGEPKFLEKYTGQTVDQLINLEKVYRIDSLVLAFEQAINTKSSKVGYTKLSDLEKAVLVIEAIEREVNNGGYGQFFSNTPQYAADAVRLLKMVGCEKTSEITQKAINELGIEGALSKDAIEDAISSDDESHSEALNEVDSDFYKYPDDIATILFNYIKQNRNQINFK